MVKGFVRFIIRFYRVAVSPVLPSACRFHPTCSVYADEAVRTRGVLAGTAAALWRVLRCNPFGRGGYDPVASPEPLDPGAPGSMDGTSGKPGMPDMKEEARF